VNETDAQPGPLPPPRSLGGYAATVAATALVTFALALLRDHLRLVDVVLTYLALSLLVAYLVGRRESALAMLLSPAGFALLILLGVNTAHLVLWEEAARVAGVAVLAVASVYAMPRWLSGADEFRATAERLRERSEFLEAMLGASPLAVISFDTEDRIVSWNAAAERIFGWQAHEVIGRVTPLFNDQLSGEFDYLRTEFRAGRDVTGLESIRVTRSGSRIDVSLSAAPLFDGKGRPAGVLALVEDITGRKAAERRTLDAEARYRLVFNQSPVGILTTDAHGNVTSLNPAGVRLLGGPDEAASVGANVLKLPNLQAAGVSDNFARVLASGEPVRFETNHVTGFGKPISISIDAAALTAAGGAVGGLVIIAQDIGARAAAAAALRASEERFRALFDQSPLGIITTDAAGHITAANTEAARLIGAPDAAAMTGIHLPTVPPVRASGMADALERSIRTRETASGSIKAVTTFGHALDAEYRLAPLLDGRGDLSGILLTLTDASEQGRRLRQLQLLAEASLAISRSHTLDEISRAATEHARLIVGAHMGSVRFTTDGDWAHAVTFFSLADKYAAYADTGAMPDGTGIYRLVCETNKPMRLNRDELQRHPAWRGFGAAADGHPPLTGWLAAPLVARDGANLGVIHLSDKEDGGDFTETDEAILVQLARMASVKIENARLLESERDQREFLDLVMQNTTDAVAAFDTQGRFTLVNRRVEGLTGYAAGEILGRDMRPLFADDEFERMSGEVAAVFAEGRPTGAIEANLVRKDGTVRRIRFRINPITVAGAVVGAVGAADDVTETRQLEEQVARSQKIESLGRLAGGVAHDFSNLMTVIIGHVELDLISLPPEEQLREDLQEIHATAQRAANLAQQLLSFSRRQMVEPRVLEMNDIVFGTEKMLRRVIGEDVRLVISAAPDTGRVKVDRGQFEQVLVNLAVNARDAMPDGGTLTIATASALIDVGQGEAKYAVLAVTDTGTGMTDEVKQHLFEPFFTTKGVGRGTGLGLATCYGIIQQAAGQIFVDSEPGKGTTFRIYMPGVEETATEEDTDQAQPLPFGSETVLLVEDEPQVRRLAARVLNDLGYRVIEAAGGNEALAIVDGGQQFDLLLTDVVMPGMNGNQLAQAVRERRPAQRVLFMSGYTDDAALRRNLSEHAIDFLPKPFAPSALARKVRDVLDRTRDA
jgi:PAS domain S-box-containing protein